MKFAVLSDTHNNLANFKKAVDWIKKENIGLILHCGDTSSQEALDGMKEYFLGGEIKFVKGNADFEMDLPNFMELEINPSASSGQAKKIIFTHFPNNAKKAAKSGKYDLVFYGHTHRAWDEKVGNCHMINPGEMAGHFYKPTFAVYNTDAELLELKILEKL